ncbi:MAG TPA: enoyl-CoA hydratase/isomerase family protein [Pilimelia sp.]|nr:enoyl-CoA hydratase/isomerase family protein [Pilimelia sp.]
MALEQGEPTDDPVRVAVTGRLGRLTLHRPRVLNALTLPMVRALRETLAGWRDDDRVRTVLVDGAGERGLCAGGDIRALRASALAGGAEAELFWRHEYRLNWELAHYPKPVVAVQDGIVMGGGVGVSAHARHRVVTERSVVSMPEVAIGFAPDVGATHLFAAAPGELGTLAALTGARFGPADAIALGLADVLVPADRLPALRRRLAAEPAEAVLAELAVPPGPAPLARARDWVDRAFAGPDPVRIRDRLAARPEPAAADALRRLDAGSPTAVAVTLAAVRRAAELPDLAACLRQEFRVSCALLRLPDFAEGVRAVVVDKDRRPRWRPATLAEVDPATVAGCFAPPASGDLEPAASGDPEPAPDAPAGGSPRV